MSLGDYSVGYNLLEWQAILGKVTLTVSSKKWAYIRANIMVKSYDQQTHQNEIFSIVFIFQCYLPLLIGAQYSYAS